MLLKRFVPSRDFKEFFSKLLLLSLFACLQACGEESKSCSVVEGADGQILGLSFDATVGDGSSSSTSRSVDQRPITNGCATTKATDCTKNGYTGSCADQNKSDTENFFNDDSTTTTKK